MVIFRALVSTVREPEWGHKLVLHQLASSWPMPRILTRYVSSAAAASAADFVRRVPRVYTCNHLQPCLPWGYKSVYRRFPRMLYPPRTAAKPMQDAASTSWLRHPVGRTTRTTTYSSWATSSRATLGPARGGTLSFGTMKLFSPCLSLLKEIHHVQ